MGMGDSAGEARLENVIEFAEYQVARALIGNYSLLAPLYAVTKAAVCLCENDRSGHDRWVRITAATRRLPRRVLHRGGLLQRP
jgi:hypothetical protein